MKVLIVVTHLLGTGHLARALTLARAFQAAGHSAKVVSGGRPVPHLDRSDVPVVQLPALQSDGVNFATLLDADGNAAGDALMQDRAGLLLQTLQDDPPDVLITELFPFGRRILRDEFETLLEAAKGLPGPPLICASVRDILAPPSNPQKVVATEKIIATFYDAVLIHSDPRITPLDLSWPVSDTLRAKLMYTGFVAHPPAAPHPDGLGQGEVIVSVGGGEVGTEIFHAALKSAAASEMQWRLLIGGKNAASTSARLARDAPANVTVEPARPEFRSMLYHATASVSMCGYNTALDLMQAGCPAVIIPFDAGSETEQSLRAAALAKQDGFVILPSAKLTPERLLEALNEVINAPRRTLSADGFDGADETVRCVARLRERSA